MRELGNSKAGLNVAESWTLLDGEEEMARVGSWDDLRAVLIDYPERAGTPNSIVSLVAPSGATLSIGVAGPSDGDNPGLAAPLASLEYANASHDPPYLVPVGDASLTFENGGVAVFRSGGQWTEILIRNCIPREVMLKVANHFFLEGTLPIWLTWEQV